MTDKRPRHPRRKKIIGIKSWKAPALRQLVFKVLLLCWLVLVGAGAFSGQAQGLAFDAVDAVDAFTFDKFNKINKIE